MIWSQTNEVDNQYLMKNLKIDWVNHLIGFLTALVGIIIAFQLDDWQERNREKEKLRITLQSIKAEIDNNMEIYRSDSLSTWLEHWDFIKSHDEDNNDEIIATEKEMNLMRAKHPTRFDEMKFIKKYRDSLNVYGGPQIIKFDVMPKAGISTSSWDAAKSSDALRSLDHARMTELTNIYDWINKDLGITDADVIRSVAGFDTDFGIDKILHDYRMITNVYGFKLRQIERHYQIIDWDAE